MTAFHAAFLQDLRTPGARGPMDVYRNGVALAAVRALADNFPTIETMLGEDVFATVAAEFARLHPPTDPVLAMYGAAFPAWLQRFAPLTEWPWLGPVARLDRAWTEAHLAADAPVLTLSNLRALGPAQMASPLRLHPSVRPFQFDWSAPSLWLTHREPGGGDLIWEPRLEAFAILRPGDAVIWRRLTQTERTFLADCAQGRALGVAMAAAQGRAPATSAVQMITGLVEAGFFTPFEPETDRA